MAVLREHICDAESEHDMSTLTGGMTGDCFNDVAGVGNRGALSETLGSLPGLHGTGATYRVDESCVVAENEWCGAHLGTLLGWPTTGKRAQVRALVVWHFKGDELWGETVFFNTPLYCSKSVPRSRSRQHPD